MKLEPKHIIAYLNYDLKVIHEEHVKEVHGFMNEEVYLDYNGIGTDMDGNELNEVTPLLLPMSALTEPTEDGSMPIVELAKIAWDDTALPDDFLYQSLKENTVFIAFSDKKNVFGYDSNTNSFFGAIDSDRVSVVNQLQLFGYLFANHFDVYGLIAAGLAVDKRTIKF